MPHWMCTRCGYYLQGSDPPNRCPNCSNTCVFNNVTCYRPECGGEESMDPLLVGATLKSGKVAPLQAKAKPMSTIMHGLPIFSRLTDEQRQRVVSLGRSETYEPNATIFTKDSQARKLYLIEEGKVVVGYQAPSGVCIPITDVSVGEVFGCSALVPPYRYTAMVSALTKTRVLAIKRNDLLALMQADPAMGLTIMQNIASIIASRLRSLELELVGLVDGPR